MADLAIAYILIFAAITGAISIIRSLNQTFSSNLVKSSSGDHSSLEAVWFKLKAPIGFVYGMFALGAVVFFLFSDDRAKLSAQLLELQNKNLQLKNESAESTRDRLDSLDASSDKPIRLFVGSDDTISVFGGSVLILVRPHWSNDTIEFRGINGSSKSPQGPFKSDPVPISAGDQLFIRLNSGQIYGLNVLDYDSSGKRCLELFLATASQPTVVQKPTVGTSTDR